MEHIAESEGFPIVGPNVGAWLRQFARSTGAKRVFEFGSGYGYSACWFGQALPEDGQIVLTDANETNLDRAASFLSRAGLDGLATCEAGDVVDAVKRYDGPSDVTLLDIEKYQYVDSFETIREKIRPGGVVLADNTMSAGRDEIDDTVDFETLLNILERGETDMPQSVPDETRAQTQGILDYLDHVRECPEFETRHLPLGDDLTVSTKRE